MPILCVYIGFTDILYIQRAWGLGLGAMFVYVEGLGFTDILYMLYMPVHALEIGLGLRV